MINESPVLHDTITTNQYLKTIMASSPVLSMSLAIIFLWNTEYISSSKCDSFKNVSVYLVDISGDEFNKTVNGCIERMAFDNRAVKIAKVANQKVPVLGEDSVRNMDQLLTFYFQKCELDIVEPFAFRNNPRLEDVQISYNNLKEIPRGVFNVIPNIKLLSFANNKVDFIESKAFANLTSLKDVFGENNNLEYWSREWFDGSINLEKINFQNNKIRTIPRKAFAALGKLKYIIFNNNEISTIQPDAFKGLRNLVYLHLRSNRLTVINEDIFPNDVKVSYLFLGMNYLNFLSNEVLKKISVEKVDLYHNPWKCPCLDRINYWLFSTNGSLIGEYRWCERSYIPLCAYSKSYSQTCLEYVDNELTQRYLENLRGITEPWLSWCARLD